jgi:hypothetical protein
MLRRLRPDGAGVRHAAAPLPAVPGGRDHAGTLRQQVRRYRRERGSVVFRLHHASRVTLPLDTSLENQFTPTLDAEGYVIGGSVTRSKGDPLVFLKMLKDAAKRFPFDPSTLVMPDGWTRDPVTGRGIRADEMGLHDGYYVTDLTTVVPEPRVAA